MGSSLSLIYFMLTVVFFLGFVDAGKNNRPKWRIVIFGMATLGFLWLSISY
ncbi:hypothetical protein [Halalkalibacillus sediminis]|uniref:hypothetical protein n=1 Tax=Halalkalibacillus sediminis TaxID=2018042 RepID=UPI00139043CC|nr:hypothetical protein [Halalkalibacillus sediminis]